MAARKKSKEEIAKRTERKTEAIEKTLNTIIPYKYETSVSMPFPETDAGVLIYGPSGTGKTHTGFCLSKGFYLDEHQINKRDRFQFITVPELLYEVRAEFSTQKRGIVEQCVQSSLLFLDDLGAEKHTDWVSEVLYHVISNRYNWHRPTIITTNIDLEDLTDGCDQRIVDRLQEYEKIDFAGEKNLRKNNLE